MTAEIILKLWRAGYSVQFTDHESGKALLIGVVKLGPAYHFEGAHGGQVRRDPISQCLRGISAAALQEADEANVVRPETIVETQLRSICEELGITLE
jgi:hypothetical protein